MTGNEIREAYLRFFQDRGHRVLPSYPLVLPEDPSTLFTVAGMQPFSPVFRGEAPSPAPRVVTAQKVFREGDLDVVGVVGRYHTFYEMMGNFSFGDYFKKEAVEFAWEFVTDVLKLDKDRLWASVYLEDDETAGYWEEAAGLPPERIVRLGKEDNWWPQNAWNGPCGPCSEIYYDRGAGWGCGAPDCGPGCSCDRYLEFWNLVFQMYLQDETGKILSPLPRRGIDTGMGLERAAALSMNVPSNFETDLVRPVLDRLLEVLRNDEELEIDYVPILPPAQRPRPEGSSSADGAYTQSNRLRGMADHIRAAAFLIADGVRPSPEARGSVLRRLIRRSFGHGWRLGVQRPFLHKCVVGVVRAMGGAYPEIAERQQYIESTILTEEEQFRSTVEQGMALLQRELDRLRSAGLEIVDGETVFTLATTHGFPVDLTRDVASQFGFAVDWEDYEQRIAAFRDASRDPGKSARGLFSPGLSQVRNEKGPTHFLGYETTASTASILALAQGVRDLQELNAGAEGLVALDSTPFYAESGGQVGDTGQLVGENAQATVLSTSRHNELWLHRVRVTEGTLRVGDRVDALVESGRRSLIMRNHTATHLMHAALHQILGPHATQAGSLVAPDRLRFDFSHPEPVTNEQIQAVEALVQDWIDANLAVTTEEGSLEDARSRGAMALFGEKYGERVRMVEIAENVSLELCGGTHVPYTGVIGLFHITSEAGIGAGLRRIEAVTGPGAVSLFRKEEQVLRQAADALKCAPDDLPGRILRMQQQLKELQRQRDDALLKAVQPAQSDSSEIRVGDVAVIASRHDGLDAAALGILADQAANRIKSGVVVLASVADGRVLFVSKVSRDLLPRGLHAGNLVKALASKTGGGGGGRPDFAQAGGRDPAAVQGALETVPALIEAMLSGTGV